MRRIRISAILVAFSMLLGVSALAQEAAAPQTPVPAAVTAPPALLEPARPEVIQSLAAHGAQIRYLGKREGFDGWLVLSQGNPSYVYVSEDGKTIFQGLMYDDKGDAVTMKQIAAVQAAEPTLNGEAQPAAAETPAATEPTIARTPGETLYDALSVMNIVTLGSTEAGAPLLYAFIDPDCPHCQDFLRQIDTPYLQTKKIQLRVIPIGVQGDESMKRAAYLLSQNNAGDLLMAHAKKEKILPAPDGLTLDGQQLNTDMFHLWRFDGTPILIFKDKSGTVMMVRGMPENMQGLVDSIAAGSGV